MQNTIKVGLVGVNGRMSRTLIETLLKDNKKSQRMEIVAGIEKDSSTLLKKQFKEIPGLSTFSQLTELRVSDDIKAVNDRVDVWVDFSLPKSTLYQLQRLEGEEAAYVIGTTGFSQSQMEAIYNYAQIRPIVMSGNFSIGINLLIYLLEQLLEISSVNYFDIEVQETHHRNKIDAPSGTANMILNKIQEIKKLSDKNIIYDRHQSNSPRASKEIGITSRRGGGVIGEHEVSFFGENEILTLKHAAINRSAFSFGVFEAIEFASQKLKKRKNGFFGIRDVLRLK